MQCGTHAVKQVRVPWAELGSQLTALFERLAIDLLRECSITGAGPAAAYQLDREAPPVPNDRGGPGAEPRALRGRRPQSLDGFWPILRPAQSRRDHRPGHGHEGSLRAPCRRLSRRLARHAPAPARPAVQRHLRAPRNSNDHQINRSSTCPLTGGSSPPRTMWAFAANDRIRLVAACVRLRGGAGIVRAPSSCSSRDTTPRATNGEGDEDHPRIAELAAHRGEVARQGRRRARRRAHQSTFEAARVQLRSGGRGHVGFEPCRMAWTVCSSCRTRRDRIVRICLITSGVSSSSRQARSPSQTKPGA